MGILAKWYGRTTGKTGPEGVACLRQPGIKALDASGHTPGHTVFETDSLLIVGDLLHAAALQIPRPEVCTIYDMNPSGAVQARRRFYEFAASSPKPVAGMHLPYPGIGRIGRSAAGYVYLPGK